MCRILLSSEESVNTAYIRLPTHSTLRTQMHTGSLPFVPVGLNISALCFYITSQIVVIIRSFFHASYLSRPNVSAYKTKSYFIITKLKPLFLPPKTSDGVLPHSRLPGLFLYWSTASCKRHLVEYCDSHITFLHKMNEHLLMGFDNRILTKSIRDPFIKKIVI